MNASPVPSLGRSCFGIRLGFCLGSSFGRFLFSFGFGATFCLLFCSGRHISFGIFGCGHGRSRCSDSCCSSRGCGRCCDFGCGRVRGGSSRRCNSCCGFGCGRVRGCSSRCCNSCCGFGCGRVRGCGSRCCNSCRGFGCGRVRGCGSRCCDSCRRQGGRLSKGTGSKETGNEGGEQLVHDQNSFISF